jgi:hypothetical protein
VVLRQADDLEGRIGAEGFAEAALDQVDGKRGDVDADPLASKPLRGVDRRSTAAEGVEDEVAGVGGGGDDALEQGDGLLGGVGKSLTGCVPYSLNVSPGT